MPTTLTDIHVLIESTPGFCGGRARIAGTRIPVALIARLTQQGATPSEIVAAYPQLGLGQIHAALAHYFTHQDEIDAEIRADDHAYDRGLGQQALNHASREDA